MHGSTVILTSLFTSVLATVGTMYLVERYGILKADSPEAVVPDLRGVTEADARANAAASHIALLIASREAAADAKPGTVVRQSAPPGQRVPRDYSLSIVIADEMPHVPSVTGLAIADAKQRLEQRGYLDEVAQVPSDTVEKDKVVEQSPKAESALAKGGTVKLQVSTGPDVVEVPKLVGVSITLAQAQLEKLSLKPVVRWISQGETPTYVVLSQKPAPTEKVKPASEVQLVACR
jgi:beta-lactam-binding protein with PASTA domain